MAKVATDNNAMEFRAASLRKRFHASLCMLAGLTIVGIGLAAMLHVSPKANAATTLTIQPNAPATLSAKAGMCSWQRALCTVTANARERLRFA